MEGAVTEKEAGRGLVFIEEKDSSPTHEAN
jgi:hypothetical protein